MLTLPHIKFLEAEPGTTVGPSQVESIDERVQQSRNEDFEPLAENSNFEKAH